jgi:hypothetical protein
MRWCDSVASVLRLFDIMLPQSCHVHWHDSFISHAKESDLANKFLPSLFLDFFKDQNMNKNRNDDWVISFKIRLQVS